MLIHQNRRMLALLAIAALCLATGCGSSSSEQRTDSQSSLDIVSAAQAVSADVGTVLKTRSSGNRGPIFVFEEFHTSRIGQLQIAAMLVRLHDKYGMRKIGLEGKTQSSAILNAAWYRNAGGDSAKDEREDLAVRMVAEGEISSAELMALQYPDIEVSGTEDAGLYAQTLDVDGNPEVDYLIGIAEKSLDADAIRKVNSLLEAKESDAAFEMIMGADPWVKERYQAMKADATVSAEEMVANLKEIQSKAAAVGARIDPKAEQGIERVIGFYQTASKRSDAMVDKILEISKTANGSPVAMIIGAAHSDKVTALLNQRDVNYALIQPADLNPKSGSLSAEQYERKAKGQWARNSKGTLGRVLNTQRKPAPVLERAEGQSYASMNLAGMLIAKAARSGRRVPDDIWAELSALPGLRVDKDSFSRDGYDVVFRAWMKRDDGREKEIWTRVGTIEHPAGVAAGTLETKLIKAAQDLKAGVGGGGGRKGGGGKEGAIGDRPPEGPKDSKPAENEGPGDARKGDLIISRTGRHTLAVYGSSREEVRRAGRISI